ncbi:hypothetical protein GGR57DRAFT_207438 [Xylariaceae sp. FL1272]|nr:hypothetical protein GGR57DRAFT_207438 [Xylariaceae sp. FL1272]
MHGTLGSDGAQETSDLQLCQGSSTHITSEEERAGEREDVLLYPLMLESLEAWKPPYCEAGGSSTASLHGSFSCKGSVGRIPYSDLGPTSGFVLCNEWVFSSVRYAVRDASHRWAAGWALLHAIRLLSFLPMEISELIMHGLRGQSASSVYCRTRVKEIIVSFSIVRIISSPHAAQVAVHPAAACHLIHLVHGETLNHNGDTGSFLNPHHMYTCQGRFTKQRHME